MNARGGNAPDVEHAIAGAGRNLLTVARPGAAQQILVDRMLVAHERAHASLRLRAERSHVPLS
jgi:hypothetical protein